MQHMSPSFWSERRIQYRNICTLCGKMDNAISLITMVSFSNNLYFICVQLLRSLKCVEISVIILDLSCIFHLQLHAVGGSCGLLLFLTHLSHWTHVGRIPLRCQRARRVASFAVLFALHSQRVLVSRGQTFCRGNHQRSGGSQRHEVLLFDAKTRVECECIT